MKVVRVRAMKVVFVNMRASQPDMKLEGKLDQRRKYILLLSIRNKVGRKCSGSGN